MKRVAFALLCISMAMGCSQAPAPKTGATVDVSSSPNLRIAIPGLVPEGCQAAPVAQPIKAYTDHLKARLEKPVLVCGTKDSASAAAALGAGEVEMALLDPESYTSVSTRARAILAPRFDPSNGRVLAVALTRKSSGIDSPAKLIGRKPIFIGEAPPSRAIPLQALADHGIDVKSFAPEVMTTEATGFKALKDGKGDMLIMTAGARQRICRVEAPKGGQCPDVVEVWRGRPTTPKAFAVSNTMSEADRYQLIGIHIAMHNDSQPAFAFISSQMPGAVFLDPSEPSALSKGTR